MGLGIARGCLAPGWRVPARVRAAVTTRHIAGASQGPHAGFNLGTRCGDDALAVAWNRGALVRLLALPRGPLWLQQVHGCAVVDADRDDLPEEPVADAAVSHRAGVVLAVLTADCLPVLLCADDGSAVGAAHAGWRGLAAGVLEAAVAALRVPPARVQAWLGPAIGAASYEVGEEVRSAFVDAHAQAASAFAPTRAGHWHCDLAALARQRLAGAGVGAVSGGGYDTLGDPRFYSFRRERSTGRFATLIWRES